MKSTEELTAKPTRTRHQILVVDDHRPVVETLTYILGTFGYDAEGVGDGRAALERMKTGGIDLVVLDLDIPILNGFQVLDELAASPKLRMIPVVVITGKFMAESVGRAVRAGARDGLIKPFEFQALRTKVARYLLPLS